MQTTEFSFRKNTRGFTLLELLIVIAIIAILSVALILVINPAETLRKSRDAQRISDLSALKTAYGLYLTSTTSPRLGNIMGGANADCSSAFATTTSQTAAYSVDGTGWIPVKLDALTGGSPISNLPVDPTNDSTYHYGYRCSGTTFEVNAKLESSEYTSKMTNDGGNNSDRIEMGTNLSL